jgi:two-component system phosphate regulon sensor histidine kinase PhoR
MAVQEHRSDPGLAREFRRLRARPAVLVTALVFAALAGFGGLGVVPALMGFAAIALAVLASAPSAPDREGVIIARTDGAVRFHGVAPAVADRLVEAVISALPQPAIALTTESLVVTFNAGVQSIAPGILRGEPLSFAFRIPDVLEAIRAVAADRQIRQVEFLQRVPIERWWEVTITPLPLPGMAANADRNLILLTLRDLTPLRLVEEMRSDFVANASHELRTPLASLLGFIETLQGSARADAPSRDRFLAIMKEQANRMARLIDDLLSLSRIQQKAHIRPEKPIDLVAIVHEVAAGLAPLALERGVEITIADQADRLAVPGDRDELIRVFENLIENALKYGAAGKRVDITLMREPATGDAREAIVSVRDYGSGIAPEHLPRLTERFYRVDNAASRAQGGTGLGLALVKHVLNRHRGRLLIESAPGTGANFAVRLPLAQPPNS